MSPRDYRPAVGKPWLFFIAGAVWLGVGIMLIEFASGWLRVAASPAAYLIAGVGLAICIYFLGFSKLARKNIRRIQSISLKRICLFAFQEWRSYPLVLFMIFLGIYLKAYSPIPKPLLAVLYIGIGGGLLSSSLHYFKQVLAPGAVELATEPSERSARRPRSSPFGANFPRPWQGKAVQAPRRSQPPRSRRGRGRQGPGLHIVPLQMACGQALARVR